MSIRIGKQHIKNKLVLERRLDYLNSRIDQSDTDLTYDTQERNAIEYAIKVISLLENVSESDVSSNLLNDLRENLMDNCPESILESLKSFSRLNS